MKRIFLISIVALLVIASSESIAGDSKPPRADKPSNTVASATAESLRAKNATLMEKMAKDEDASHKKNLELMTRTEAALARQEQDMTKHEQDLTRFEKILDTWQRQQAQYQKYLDSLPTSKGRK
jgi:hypothetical protein